MHTDHLIRNFEKRAVKQGMNYHLGSPASIYEIEQTQKRLKVKFPSQVKMFYQTINGLQVKDPHLEILCLNKIKVDEAGRIHFATFDQKHRICFDTTKINNAEQWDILNLDTGFTVTLTMASFWTNKIWAWIDSKRTIWKEEVYC